MDETHMIKEIFAIEHFYGHLEIKAFCDLFTNS